MRFTAFLVGFLVLSFLGCTSSDKRRSLASENTPAHEVKDLSDGAYLTLADLTLSATDSHYFRVIPVLNVDRNKARLAKQAEKALNEAFARAFVDLSHVDNGDSHSSLGNILGRFKAHLPGTIIKNFVTTIEVFKLFGLDLRYEWQWWPEDRQNKDFGPEFESNDLAPLWRQGKLKQALAAEETKSFSETIRSYKKLAGENVRFLGATVILNARTVDFEVFKRSPSLFSGEIIIRRFIQHKTGRLGKVISNDKVQLEEMKWSNDAEVSTVSTLDVVYKIDVKEKNIVLSQISIYPGSLVVGEEIHDKALPQRDLVVRGTRNGFLGFERNFQGRVSKVSFSPDLKELSIKASEIESVSGVNGRVREVVFSANRSELESVLNIKAILGGQ